ncbi:MAG: methylated-DNA--[protein]-cysteine S-methyltransferase [Phycisphaerales bacterium JB037]
MNRRPNILPTGSSRTLETPIGPVGVVASEAGVRAVEFGGVPESAGSPGSRAMLARAADELSGYFAGTRRVFTVPIDQPGTPFRQRVWQELARIPFGTTISYGELARRIENPSSVRAVGGANGANRVPIIVPCHRVIAADGTLHGFGGGLQIKRRLLEHEGALEPLLVG